jgi:hypothetical protein
MKKLKKLMAGLVLFELTALSIFCTKLFSVEPSWNLFMACQTIALAACFTLILGAAITIWAITELFK